MNFNEYQDKAMETAIYPNRGDNLVYAVLGLTNEAGEVAGKLKKCIRDNSGKLTPEIRQAVADEVSDVMWYIAACCFELGVSMNDVAVSNLAKLKSRQERGVLGGSGDKR